MGWIKERFDAIKDAAGIRWEVAGLLVSLAISRIDWFYQKFYSSPDVGGQMIFGFPSWILGITVFLVFLSFWLLEYAVKLRKEREPKLSIKFDPYTTKFFNHENIIDNSSGGKTIERRALLMIHNDSAMEPVDHMEVFCTEIKVLNKKENAYSIKITGSQFRRKLAPQEDIYVGLVRQLIVTDDSGLDVQREFQIQIPNMGAYGRFEGNDFIIETKSVGINTSPAYATFQFGERDGVFYCEQINEQG